jgi:hypothetical protein
MQLCMLADIASTRTARISENTVNNSQIKMNIASGVFIVRKCNRKESYREASRLELSTGRMDPLVRSGRVQEN